MHDKRTDIVRHGKTSSSSLQLHLCPDTEFGGIPSKSFYMSLPDDFGIFQSMRSGNKAALKDHGMLD